MNKHLFYILTVVLLSFFPTACSCATVNPGEVGVEVKFGKLNDHQYNPGFHIYSVLSDDLYILSTRMQTYTFGGVQDQRRQTTAETEEVNVNIHSGPSIQILSSDQLQVVIDITIQYHLNGTYAPAVYREFGADYNEALVVVPVRSAVRNSASNFIARDLVTHREQLQTTMEDKIAEQIALTLRAKNINAAAIIVDNVSLRQIDLPDSLENSIRQVQEQQMQTLQRQSAIETARQEAERLRIEAEGATQAQRIRAEGNAEANRIMSASLTPQIMRLRELEAQYAMNANPNARLVVVPYGQPTVISAPPMAAVAASGR